MGQYWQIINIDKRQTTGFIGKLGEFFFASQGRVIIRLINPQKWPEASGAWAGDRIMCIGDYAYDVPNKYLTDAEQAELAENKSDLYGFASEQYVKVHSQFMFSWALPEGEEWVMRNLTKKQYVRESKLRELEGDVGFDQVLYLWTLCSSDPSISMASELDVEGIWTGDRIDIDTIESVEEGWEDLSYRAVRELEQIIVEDGY
ncbi:hypothetical protein AX16_004998 [Volvariella volvacea WC 439]|nr:hypothetical protein AX16_004998 [Volvariella volvacea WC 439]